MTTAPSASEKETGPSCPICGKSVTARFRPFCSARCADVDLHRWFTGAYRVPVVEREEDETDDDGEAHEE